MVGRLKALPIIQINTTSDKKYNILGELNFLAKKIWERKPYLLFIIPGFIIYTVFIVYPMVSTFFNSLTEWDGMGKKVFIGIQNYRTIFLNENYAPSFYNAFFNGIQIVVSTYILQLPLALYFAYLFYKGIKWGKLMRTIIFFPQVVSMVAVSFLALTFLDPNFGVINVMFNYIGLESLAKPWIGFGDSLIYITAILLTWKGIGVPMMLILANLMSIPEEHLEAAEIDGARERQKFFRIILPQLGPSISVTCVAIFLGGIAAFEIPYLVGDKYGGPRGVADTLGTFFYRVTFGSEYLTNNIGLGTAIAVTQFMIMLIVSIIQLNVLSRNQTDI